MLPVAQDPHIEQLLDRLEETLDEDHKAVHTIPAFYYTVTVT